MPDISMIKAMVPQGNLNPQQAAEKIAAGWWIQQKYDGRRIIVGVNSNAQSIFVLNRDGTESNMSNAIRLLLPLDWMRALHKTIIIDGEFVKNRFFAFDLIHFDGRVTPHTKYSTRYKVLRSFLNDNADQHANKIRTVSTVADDITPAARFDFIEQMYHEGAEGIILRNAHAPYRFGRSKMIERLKFRKRIDAFITNLHPQKSSATLALWDPEGETHKTLCDVSTLHHNVEFMNVVELEFSHLSPEGKPQQPVLKGVREDKDTLSCTVDQLENLPTINNADIIAMKEQAHGTELTATMDF